MGHTLCICVVRSKKVSIITVVQCCIPCAIIGGGWDGYGAMICITTLCITGHLIWTSWFQLTMYLYACVLIKYT